MARCPATSTRGFTLIELLVVIIIIVTLSAMAVPSFESGLSGSRVRGKLTRISQMAGLAASLAAQDARPYRLVFDSDAQRIWIESEPDPLREPGVFAPLGMSGIGSVDLAEDLRIGNVVIAVEEENAKDRPPAIEFRRDGTCDGGIVVLKTPVGDAYTVQVAAMTSRVRVMDFDLIKAREDGT